MLAIERMTKIGAPPINSLLLKKIIISLEKGIAAMTIGSDIKKSMVKPREAARAAFAVSLMTFLESNGLRELARNAAIKIVVSKIR